MVPGTRSGAGFGVGDEIVSARVQQLPWTPRLLWVENEMPMRPETEGTHESWRVILIQQTCAASPNPTMCIHRG